MSHSHQHDHVHDHSSGNIRVAFFLNLGFTIIEIIGGILTNSVAILSDAIHDLGDSLSLGLAWYLQNLSHKGRTKRFTYGFKRFSLLGAIITSMVLIVGSVIILYEAIPRLSHPEPANSLGMIGLAVLGVLINGAAVLRTRSGASINEQVVSWHLLEDVLGWVAVLLGALVMYFFDLPIIDPILSIAITLFVLYNVVLRLIKAGHIILQAAPEQVDIDAVKEKLKGIGAVENIHHTHLWSLDGNYHIVTVHAGMDGQTRLQELAPIKKKIRQELHDIGIEHVTIEFESLSENCKAQVDF
ncbi:cation diffusion facilitator family transporter [Flavilitoribacter nigricans]|uniref:Cation transporter n=1 Tax=Flavilitoribacter nigricans (strain ATCC 23147 / DSM 23189 / NBRC 102662 / NCIMB 1420 / SS-2) TaxID=1122177 RepID=A0A2D0NGP5_FLAN2|nr:cation diffusion facilitator family transporter [Flavilitoribacter nigricans]PHN07665.1 cation transporter [Flavilitoribacter nigricans DSM 23189 = NBRC 102662]